MDDWQEVEQTATGSNGEKVALINGEWTPVTHTATGANGKKLALYRKQQSSEIPGGVIPQEQLRAKYNKKKQAEIDAAGGNLNYGLAGVGETALNLVSQVPAQFAGAAAVGLHGLGKLFGVYDKNEDTAQAASNVMEKMIYQPRTEVGQEYTNAVGDIVNRYLMPLGPGMHVSPFTKAQRQIMSAERLRPTKSGLGFEKVPTKETPVAPPQSTALSDAIKAAKAKQSGVVSETPNTVWESTVKDLGGEIVPPETPFSSMVDTLSGKPRVIEPEFKMAPEEAPYKKTGAEAAADDATVARLQAAIDKQNPTRDTMMVTPEGQAYIPTSGSEAGRKVYLDIQRQIEQTLQKEIEGFNTLPEQMQQVLKEREMQKAQEAIAARQAALESDVARQASLDRNAAERARQQTAPTGYEEWVAQQRQAAEQRLPGNNEPLNFNKESAPYSLGDTPYQYKGGLDFTQQAAGDMQAPVIKSMQEKAAWEQRAKEQQAEQGRLDAIEAKQQAQEGRLQPLEEQLRREAYQPPTQEDLRAGHLSGRSPRVGKFGQGGAIDPKLAEDLYGFAKSVVRGYNGLLKPLFRGVKSDYPYPERTMPGIKGTGVYLTEDPGFASLYAEGAEGGNLRQAYVNLENPLVVGQWDGTMDKVNYMNLKQRDSWTAKMKKEGYDGVIVKKADGSIAEAVVFDPKNVQNALAPSVNKFGQGGSAPMLKDLAEGIVNTVKGAYRIVKPETPPDTLTHPTSPENIAKKQEMAKKAKAVGLKGSVWDTPTTVEEAIATTEKDLSPLTQRLGAGAAGTAHRNPKNGVVKYINDIRQKSQQAHERLVTQYLNGKTGAAKALRDVPSKEYPAIMRLKIELAKEKVDYTPEIGQAAGLSEKAQVYMEATQRAINASADAMDSVAKMAGMEPLNRQRGYFGSNWDRGYPARVGYWKERIVNGKKERYFETKAFVSEETALGRRNASNWYKEKYPGISVEYLGRQKINTSTNPIRGFDALGTIMSEIAKHDPEFAKWKEIADTRIAENTAKLYGVDKHFLEKAGVEGYRGNQPWKSEMANAKEGLLSEIEHLNSVFKYATQQEFVNNAKKIVSDPRMQDKKHTLNWVDSYTKHVTGEGLNPVGAGMNSIVDGVFRGLGLGGNIPHKISQAIRTVAQSMILNISNVRYATVNTLQILNAIPEMAKVMADAGLGPLDITSAMANGSIARSTLGVAALLGKNLDDAPIAPHLIEAYKWGQEHGIHHYTETVNSREVLDSKAVHYAKKVGAWPSTVPEWLTRPTAFLWFVDLFHKSGLRGEELYTKARGATDYALANAVKEEKASIYTSLGIMGNHIGELKNYSHNIADQYTTRVLEAKDHKLALATSVGIGLLTAGVSGTMFYQEADAISQWLTGKTLREHAGWMGKNHYIYDGVISATSGSDWQSSFSMADGLADPTKPWETIAGVSVMKMLKMGMAGYEYATDPSHAHLAELAKNTIGGLQGVVEDKMLTSPEGYVLDKKGQHKYESPRTPEERNKRAIMGVRPLRERIEDESLYARDKAMKKINEKDKKYLEALVAGLNFNDPAAVQRALNGFIDNKGDLDKLSNIIDKNELEAYVSARQRHGGIDPGDSLTTIRRWMNYNESK